MKIMIMAGTRPEAIKVAPVVSCLKATNNADIVLCNAGQHKEMIRQAFADFSLEPDIVLDVMLQGQTLAGLNSRLFAAIDPVLDQEKPDWVLVQGDTNTVMVGALCAFYRNIRVGHIEAGLRTYNRRSPFPEEVNRQIVTRVADLHFAPTQVAVDNLLRDGIDAGNIILTGNTVIDSLLAIHKQVATDRGLLLPEARDLLASGKRMILITGHRRENFGESFKNMCGAMADIAGRNPDAFILYPVHLNPNVQDVVFGILNGRERVLLTTPMAYRQFVAHIGAAHIILTDSGGIQEEAPALNKPVLVMRDTTERPEGVEAGVALLVGTGRDAIVREVERLLNDSGHYRKMAAAANPYGDGHAAERIANAILSRNAETRIKGENRQ